MIDFATLQEFVYNNRVIDSDYHGLEHWRQVEFNGLLLAPRTGADITVVRLFALFHDCKREDDGYDAVHGERGAEFAKQCFEEKRLDITQEQFDKLYYACKMHTHERNNDDVTISTCYDADRLDLGRVGIPLNPEKMATALGSKIAKRSLKEHVSVYGMREWIRKLNLP
jgi:uncharacterized protein